MVFDEFRVEGEPCMLDVVGSEPAFDLSQRRRFADSSDDMLDPFGFGVCVEAGLAFAYAPEL